MPELSPDYFPLQTILSLPDNAKEHDVGDIISGIQTHGFLHMIIVNEATGHLLAGHGRVKALRAIKAAGGPRPRYIMEGAGGTWLVPGYLVDVPEELEAAAAIKLNRSGERGGWDHVGLARLLSDIAALDAVLFGDNSVPTLEALTGFDNDELDGLLARQTPYESSGAPGRPVGNVEIQEEQGGGSETGSAENQARVQGGRGGMGRATCPVCGHHFEVGEGGAG